MLINKTKYLRYGGRLYRAKDEDAFGKATERVSKDTPKQKAKRHIKTLVDGVVNHATELLNKATLKAAGDPEVASAGEGQNPTGVSIKFSVAAENFSGMPSDLYFDYLVSGAEGDEGPVSFWEDIQKVITQPQEKYLDVVGKGNYKLRQLVLHMCGANYGSKDGAIPSIPKLLEAVGFIQSTANRHPTQQEGRELDKGSTDEQQRDHFIMVLMDVKRAYEYIIKKSSKNDEERKKNLKSLELGWGDKEKVKKALNYVNSKSNKKMKPADLAALLKFIDAEPDIGDIMRGAPKAPTKVMTGPGALRETLQRRLANIINRPPYSINYTAWDDNNMDVMGGKNENETVVALTAPMHPVFVFTKVLGGTLKLQTASIMLCKQAFVVKTEQDASKLVWSGVVLGFARKLGANPEAKRHVPADNYFDVGAEKAAEDAMEKGEPVPEKAGGEAADFMKALQ